LTRQYKTTMSEQKDYQPAPEMTEVEIAKLLSHPESLTQYHLRQIYAYAEKNGLSDDMWSQVGNLAVLLSEKPFGEQYLDVVRFGFENHDPDALYWVFNEIQKAVHGSSRSKVTPVSAGEVEDWLTNKDLMIPVGGGTSGERIYVDGQRMFMYDDPHYGHEYRRNFRSLFGIPMNDSSVAYFSEAKS